MLYVNVSSKAVRVEWAHSPGQPPAALEVEPGEVFEAPGGAYVGYFRREWFGAIDVAPEGAAVGKAKPPEAPPAPPETKPEAPAEAAPAAEAQASLDVTAAAPAKKRK